MKIQKSSSPIGAFSGISFIHNDFVESGFSHLIDNELSMRSVSIGYRYSDIIKNLFQVFYSGGDCIEDIHSHLRHDLQSIPGNAVPSPDTLLRGIKELVTANTIYISPKSKKSYNFNINKKLNTLLIKGLLKTKQLTKGGCYDFDYDNQIIPTEKYDAKMTYKKAKGYCPGIATIDDKIVFIENRDGNANVKFMQSETLKRAYQELKSQEITVNRSRMDAGSYAKEIIDVVDTYSKLFYIRSNRSTDMYDQIRAIENWVTVEINNKIYEVASLKFIQFNKEKNYRQVIMREKSNSIELDLFTGDAFTYRSILTNDWKSSEKEVIEFYNQRGKSERHFDAMNNDFGWNKLPCSFMNENTVFMILMAMAKNYYLYFINKVSKVFDDIQPTSRLKRFIFRFITVPGKWMFAGRQWVLKLFTDRPYEQLIV